MPNKKMSILEEVIFCILQGHKGKDNPITVGELEKKHLLQRAE